MIWLAPEFVVEKHRCNSYIVIPNSHYYGTEITCNEICVYFSRQNANISHMYV